MSLFIYFFRATLTAHGGSQARVGSELQLLAYTAATPTWDQSCVCDLHHSSWQHHIFNLLSKARDQAYVPMDTSRVCNHCTTMETPIMSQIVFHYINNALKSNLMHKSFFHIRVNDINNSSLGLSSTSRISESKHLFIVQALGTNAIAEWLVMATPCLHRIMEGCRFQYLFVSCFQAYF